jgi:hypothetical protein
MNVCRVVSSQVEVSATSQSPIQRSPTDCGVCVWSRKTNLVNEEAKAHWGAIKPRKKKLYPINSMYLLLLLVSFFWCVHYHFVMIYRMNNNNNNNLHVSRWLQQYKWILVMSALGYLQMKLDATATYTAHLTVWKLDLKKPSKPHLLWRFKSFGTRHNLRWPTAPTVLDQLAVFMFSTALRHINNHNPRHST